MDSYVHNYDHYDEQFQDYLNRHSHYQLLIPCRDTFEMVCRLTFILGEPIGVWIAGYQLDYNQQGCQVQEIQSNNIKN